MKPSVIRLKGVQIKIGINVIGPERQRRDMFIEPVPSYFASSKEATYKCLYAAPLELAKFGWIVCYIDHAPPEPIGTVGNNQL
jgi:hypothetical protein